MSQQQHASAKALTGQIKPKKNQQQKQQQQQKPKTGSGEGVVSFATRRTGKKGKGAVWVQLCAQMEVGSAIALSRRAAQTNGWYSWVVAGGSTVVLRCDAPPTFTLEVDGAAVEVKTISKEEGVALAAKGNNNKNKKKKKDAAEGKDAEARRMVEELRLELQGAKGAGSEEMLKELNAVKKDLKGLKGVAQEVKRQGARIGGLEEGLKETGQGLEAVKTQVSNLEKDLKSSLADTRAEVAGISTQLGEVREMLTQLLTRSAPSIPSNPTTQDQPPQTPAKQKPDPDNAKLLALVTGAPHPELDQTPARDDRKQTRQTTAKTPGGTEMNPSKKNPKKKHTKQQYGPACDSDVEFN